MLNENRYPDEGKLVNREIKETIMPEKQKIIQSSPPTKQKKNITSP